MRHVLFATSAMAWSAPLLLALALFAWLVVGGAAINRWVPALIG